MRGKLYTLPPGLRQLQGTMLGGVQRARTGDDNTEQNRPRGQSRCGLQREAASASACGERVFLIEMVATTKVL